MPLSDFMQLTKIPIVVYAATVTLTADDLSEIENAASHIPIQGARLPEAVLKWSHG